jgi:type IV pilus assembly protein PilQ
MSKLNCIDKKRRLYSFLIYILIAAWLLFGCASKSSVEMDAAEVDSQPPVEDVNADDSSSATAPEEKAAEKKTVETADLQDDTGEYTESEPRIFFEPSDSKLGQILGIDFSMMPQEKSRLTVTTNKRVAYDLDRINSNIFALNFHDSKISNEVLLRHIDTTEYQTALEKIQPVFDEGNNEVSLNITFREVVPYTINQSDDDLIIDFDRIKSKIPEKIITPVNVVETKTQQNLKTAANTGFVSHSSASQAKSNIEIQAGSPSVTGKYTGEKMGSLEFYNTDVTNILKLINEISGENIIWDPAIKGRTVSMELDDVPWDQALELIMKNNELAKRQVGENIIWITTKQKMAQILQDEEAEDKRINEKLENERQKKIAERKREEDDSPLITEYIPVDFAKAEEITEHILVSERGKISIDTRTNTIIMTDTEKSVEDAIKVRNQFDIPVKQIMIEARIVDASENFSRDLGLKWNEDTSYYHDNDNTSLAVPASALDDLTFTGQRVYGSSFSTNTPDGWAGNIGFNYAKASSSGMGRLTLDASLALAESEGTAKVISAPKVIAREGSSATISSGDKIVIDAAENVAATTLDATLSLTVTPTSVSANDYITLDVNVTDDQAPSKERILKKNITTTLMVKSGETVVIGGIIKETEGESISGVPVLKDIPGIGWLFKSKSKNNRKSELLIFLTPTVQPTLVKR